MVATAPLRGAGAFARGHDALQAPLPPPTQPAGSTVYDGEGWLAGRRVHTRCRAWGAGYEVAIDELHRYWVASTGDAIIELTSPPDRDDSTVVLGPPLMLALALRNTYCLHASAVELEGTEGILALCGPSGAGKSTLAAAAEAAAGWRRCADDIVGVSGVSVGAALVHVPQLKLGDEDQPGRELPEELPLRGIVQLHAPAEHCSLRIEALAGAAAVRCVVAATVAARLLPPHAAAAHLVFCADLARVVPVVELLYPRRLEALPEVLATLAAWTRDAATASPPPAPQAPPARG